jgi:hypothetical protein
MAALARRISTPPDTQPWTSTVATAWLASPQLRRDRRVLHRGHCCLDRAVPRQPDHRTAGSRWTSGDDGSRASAATVLDVHDGTASERLYPNLRFT